MRSTSYVFLVALVLAMGLGLIFLPEKENHKEVSPEVLLQELDDQSRFLTTDKVAELLINQYPTLLLFDVREQKEYETFSLPGAMNVPLEEVLNETYGDYFDRDEMSIVFFSNGDVKSEQAWMLKKRAGYDNIFIMKGGLNQWTKDIMMPEKPADTAPQEAFDQYLFRKAACKFFIGGSTEIIPDEYVEQVAARRSPQPKTPKKEIKVLPKKVEEEEEEEGC